MAGQFLNEDDSTVSLPPIVPPVNAGSSATGEPKGKAPVPGSFVEDSGPPQGQFIDDPSPASAPQGQFLAPAKDDAPLSAKQITDLQSQGWRPTTDEHFKTIFDAQDKAAADRGLVGRGWDALKGVGSSVANMGSGIAATPPNMATHARAKKIFASIAEGTVNAAEGLASLIGMPVGEDVAAGRIPVPGGSYVRAALQTPEEAFQERKLAYMAQNPSVEEQPDTALPYPGMMTPNWIRGGVAPDPALSAGVSTLASFMLPEAAAAGASKLAATSLLRPLVHAGELATAIPAAAARAAYEATDLSKSVPIGTVAGAFPKLQAAASNLIPEAGAVGRGVAKLGDWAKEVGEAPETGIKWAAGKLLGSDVAEKMAEKLGAYELPIAGAAFVLGEPAIAAVITGLKGIAKAGPVISGFGRYMERLAQADPGQFGKLYTLARDQSAPSWMQAASSHAAVKALASAGDIAKNLGVSAAHGAAFGAAIGALPGQDLASNIGGGLGYGLVGGGMYQGRMKEARILQRSADSNLALYKSHVAEGISPDSLKKVGTDAWTWASTMQQVLGGETKIRFAGKGDAAMPAAVHDQAGMYDPATKTVWVNTDANRNTSDTLLHEIMHPLFEGAINDHPELADQVNKALASDGFTIADAKQTYVDSLLSKSLEAVTDPAQRQAAIDAQIKVYDDNSQEKSGNPDTWMHSEILAEAGAKSLYGTHPVIDVANNGLAASVARKLTPNFLNTFDSLKDTALQYAQTAFEKLGVTFKQSESGKTILPGFENVVASPALRRAVYRLIRERKNLVPEAGAEPRGVPLTPKVWGKHPGATLETRPDGTTGNDFVLQKPDGRIVERPNREVKKIVGNRRKEINRLYPVSDTPLPSSDQTPGIATRTTPSGLVERSGTNLGPGFDSLTTVGAKTKANAHAIEQAIADGTSMQGWYQQIGKESGAGDWKASVQKDTGAIEAQHKEFIPINFLVDKQSNLLVRNYSLTAFDRKAAAWAARSGPVSLDEFGGDVGKFKEAVAQYLKNHDEGLPGDASGVGSAKRDIINAFLVGGNRTFEAKNPLRPLLKGADRQGVVRSYRLDRLETLDKGDSTLAQPDYSKQVQNMSPAQAKSRAKKKSLFAETSALTSKGWILPNSEFVPLQGDLHSSFLLSKADELKKAFGIDFSKYPDTDANEGPRIPALNKGFARVNYERASGTLTIEANAAHWSKATRDSIFSIVADNAAKIDNIKIALLDDKANIKKYDSSQLFQYDDKEKLEHIPFVSESSSGRRMSPDTTKKKIEIEGPDGTKYPAYFDGYQDFSAIGKGKMAQITPLVDIPGTIKGSTTYDNVLQKRGFKIPDLSQFSPDTAGDADYRNSGEAFKDFFSQATRGEIGKSAVPWEPNMDLSKEAAFRAEQTQHTGNFDEHIAKSIPGFRETQIKTGNAIVRVYPQGAEVLDIAASEGSYGKTISALSGGKIKTTSLDPNPDMAKFFDLKSKVSGATYDTSAFLHGFDDGGTHVPAYKPAKRFDVVHESMGFQFISPERGAQIAEAKRLMKPDGVMLTEQKVLNGNWAANEAHKDANYKSKYFSGEDLAKKNKIVGFQQSEQETKKVGMLDNMVHDTALEGVLAQNFKHVTQYWDSGNFKGYAASDNPEALQKLVGNMGDLKTDYSTVPTPRKVFSPDTSEAMTEAGKSLMDKHGYTLTDEGGDFGTGMTTLRLKDTDGKQVGALSAHQTGPEDATVDAVHVNHAHQAQGIGEVLYRELAARLQKAGVTSLDGNVIHPAPLKIREKLFGAPQPLGEPGQNAWGASTQKVRSTIDPNQQFSPDKTYSQVDKVIEDKFKGESMPRAQLAAMLRNPQNGIKAEEMKWSGLDDLLKGSGKITKKELQDHLEQNRVQVNEIQKGGERNADPRDIEALKEGVKRLDAEHYYREPMEDHREGDLESHYNPKIAKARAELDVALDTEDWSKARNRIDKLATIYEDAGLDTRSLDKLSALASTMEAATDGTGDNATQYEKYQLPGGENYRELLFQLPPKGRLLLQSSEHKGEFDVIDPRNGFTRYTGGLEDARAYIKEEDQSNRRGDNFKTNHFDEPNIVAHSRVNDRTDTEGKPGLFAEEIQSDWHQEGRKKGYAGNSPKAESAKYVEGEGWTVFDKDGKRLMSIGSRPDEPVENVLKQADQIIASGTATPYKSLVPNAPFKTTWHEMVMRRLIQKAVTEGKDWLGWTTGDQQATRYDLSKQVSSIYARKREDGTFSISVIEKGKGTLTGIGGEIKADELSDYVGKDLADKMVLQKPSTGPTVYDGLDLKVGGKGMAGFYDKMLVDYANKFGKKFGAKVEDRKIPGAHDASRAELFTDRAKAVRVLDGGGEVYAVFKGVPGETLVQNYNHLLELEQENGNSFASGYYLGDKQPEMTVHSLPITPEMKKSVAETGVSIFSPDLDKKIEKMPSIHADEMPEETAYYWMKQNGQLIPVASHDGAAAKLGVGVDDLYSNGLLRVAVRAEEGTNKSVWLNSHDIAIPTPKQRQAIEALKDRGFQVSDGSTGSAMSPDLPSDMFSKREMNPQGEKQENIQDESLLYPERELTPTEAKASNLARKELRDRIQILPDADDRVKLRRALNRGFVEVTQSVERQATDKAFDTGGEWYKKDMDAMEDTTKKIFPETKDPTKMVVFKSLLAALSPSAKPPENYRSAAEGFAQYLKTGKFAYTTPYRVSETGKRRQLGLTAESAMGKLNDLLKQSGGEQQLVNYLTTKHDVTVYGNKEAYGALDLGPKVGRFMLNLLGHGEEVTVDMWATRTFNRWMGTPFRKQKGKAILPDIPTEAERNVMIDAFNQLAPKLSESTGIPMKAMDVQAVLWYLEKDLYADASDSGRTSFADAAKSYEAKPLHKLPRTVTNDKGIRVKSKAETKADAANMLLDIKKAAVDIGHKLE